MKILLHICCGPCSLFPIDDLKSAYPDIVIDAIFYNPNIHPLDEFEKRLGGAITATAAKDVPLIIFKDFDQPRWDNFAGSDLERCAMCYSTRLGFVSKYAADNGYTHFTTSLLVSPYQKHDLIAQTGAEFAKLNGIEFLSRDFRPGFRNGQNQARELGIYRQKYCGCLRGKE
ncbi:MAG: epoxyqueuosine reductase QueH [Clostridiales bacterium]|nr:epoxyqueuosine reductase QueH [Clostridiales bacterium]